MFQIAVGTAIAFLVIAGIVEICVRAQSYLMSVPEGRVVFMVPSRGRDESIEYVIRSVYFRAREQQRALPEIVVVDDGMDEQTRAICEKLALDLGCVRICHRRELAEDGCMEKV